ncbi:hypothetical protein A2U01_0076559, partial [Trifolium medium]|nr:hypothetical protein [Trifolium medium]
MVFGTEKALVRFLPALHFSVLAATVLSLDRAMDGGFFFKWGVVLFGVEMRV